MSGAAASYQAVIIGGGFYGASIALYLLRQRGFTKVLIVEREAELMQRASYHNQARIHNGYHYPRSFTTAFRSRINLPVFMQDYSDSVVTNFTKLYAIARHNSKVNAKQFTRFCREIGARLSPAPADLKALFNPLLIEDAMLVEEYAFNTQCLHEWAVNALAAAGAEIAKNTTVTQLYPDGSGRYNLNCVTQDGVSQYNTGLVFNCSYSGLKQIDGYPCLRAGLKHEITEMALLKLPATLENLGITVMDGPFFSMMPFPARRLHTLSHVRYTPHSNWADKGDKNPYEVMGRYARQSRANHMIRDTARYLPAIASAQHMDSLFEIKTVLAKNEGDDGRPILFERYEAYSGCYTVLGGKIDNIYDILQKLDTEPLERKDA